jgi:HPt (histidine-containing phosphotransfer) domain-containing protein
MAQTVLANLSLIQIKQEAEALETEIRVMESEPVIAEDIDSVSDVREERTRKYIEEHFVNIDDLAICQNRMRCDYMR